MVATYPTTPEIVHEPYTIGYRGWRVSPQGKLSAIVHTMSPGWRPGLNQAYCSDSETPDCSCDCGCGYYAYRYINRRHWESNYFDARQGNISWGEGLGLVGGVALWQEKTISCGEGIIQANYAAVGCLVIGHNMDTEHRRCLKLASKVYQVPIVSLKQVKKNVDKSVQRLRKGALQEVAAPAPLSAFQYDYNLLM